MVFATSTYDLITLLISETIDEQERSAAFQKLVSQPITPQALSEARRAMRERMIPVSLSKDAIDTCGTGGSGKKTINTSTLAAFIVAVAGGKIAKHGNRSASGNCGSFDLLEYLGARINLLPKEEKKVFDELGIVFLFAPLHHPAMRFVGPLRKAHGKKTLFNYLGPLSNPAGVKRQLIGNGNHEAAMLFVQSLQQDGDRHAMIVTGDDGLDEVSVTAPTTIRTVKEAEISETRFSPEQLNLPFYAEKDIEGGTAAENAAIFLDLAKGQGDDARKALVLVNAAHALRLTDRFSSLAEAYATAKEILASGKVLALIEQYCRLTNSVKS
ncbi:MAG: anthranilate phosphoribosyltransferase [Candidatus Peribacteraceae bacterium]|nr:anthranilate phosphoribosyltransferase [Candidatus Peribacteraceae bacterium]